MIPSILTFRRGIRAFISGHVLAKSKHIYRLVPYDIPECGMGIELFTVTDSTDHWVQVGRLAYKGLGTYQTMCQMSSYLPDLLPNDVCSSCLLYRGIPFCLWCHMYCQGNAKFAMCAHTVLGCICQPPLLTNNRCSRCLLYRQVTSDGVEQACICNLPLAPILEDDSDWDSS